MLRLKFELLQRNEATAQSRPASKELFVTFLIKFEINPQIPPRTTYLLHKKSGAAQAWVCHSPEP